MQNDEWLVDFGGTMQTFCFLSILNNVFTKIRAIASQKLNALIAIRHATHISIYMDTLLTYAPKNKWSATKITE